MNAVDGSLPLEARGLFKSYGSIAAVDDVDLTVHAGDVYGFLGPNGASRAPNDVSTAGNGEPFGGSKPMPGSPRTRIIAPALLPRARMTMQRANGAP